MSLHLPSGKSRIHIYFLAGVATSPDFMEEFRLRLVHQFHHQGWDVKSKDLFPYGDWNRKLIWQVQEIYRDLLPGISRKSSWIAGRRIAQEIKMSYQGGSLLIIGHSGGGVAGVHAAQLLMEELQIPDLRIVQIGSPKCGIPLQLRKAVLYIRSLNEYGDISDPITRLGSWGGWKKGKYAIPHWDAKLYAPQQIMNIPLLGGHQDYFRSQSSFCNKEGRSNMLILLQVLKEWLDQ